MRRCNWSVMSRSQGKSAAVLVKVRVPVNSQSSRKHVMAPVSATAGVIYNSNLSQQRAISVKQWVFMSQMAVLVACSFYPLTHPLRGLHTSLQSLHLACCSSLASTLASLDLHQHTSPVELRRSLPNMSARTGQTCFGLVLQAA